MSPGRVLTVTVRRRLHFTRRLLFLAVTRHSDFFTTWIPAGISSDLCAESARKEESYAGIRPASALRSGPRQGSDPCATVLSSRDEKTVDADCVQASVCALFKRALRGARLDRGRQCFSPVDGNTDGSNTCSNKLIHWIIQCLRFEVSKH